MPISAFPIGDELLDLPCAMQSALAPILEMTSVEFRKTLYSFGYTYIKNSPQKMIVKCNIKECQ